MDATATILALDVGSVRIGLALASNAARLASPHGTIRRQDNAVAELSAICDRERVERIVIGLPRGMSGQDTQQTADVQAFGKQLEAELKLPISWQDEAVTSVRAEEELQARGRPFAKADIDALAATYILEDYLHG